VLSATAGFVFDRECPASEAVFEVAAEDIGKDLLACSGPFLFEECGLREECSRWWPSRAVIIMEAEERFARSWRHLQHRVAVWTDVL
jgi:hypothetical protein